MMVTIITQSNRHERMCAYPLRAQIDCSTFPSQSEPRNVAEDESLPSLEEPLILPGHGSAFLNCPLRCPYLDASYTWDSARELADERMLRRRASGFSD